MSAKVSRREFLASPAGRARLDELKAAYSDWNKQMLARPAPPAANVS